MAMLWYGFLCGCLFMMAVKYTIAIETQHIIILLDSQET